MVGKYNNTYQRIIKMKPVDVKLSAFIDFGVKNNHKNPKVKVGDYVRISKYQKAFAKRLQAKLVRRSFCY